MFDKYLLNTWMLGKIYVILDGWRVTLWSLDFKLRLVEGEVRKGS